MEQVLLLCTSNSHLFARMSPSGLRVLYSLIDFDRSGLREDECAKGVNFQPSDLKSDIVTTLSTVSPCTKILQMPNPLTPRMKPWVIQQLLILWTES